MTKGKARILVIDDETEIVRILQRSLAAHGYDVLTANSGEKALEVMEHARPDLLLLDLGLPDIDGLEVCKRIRAKSNLPPIIVVSVRDTEREKVQALDLGADDYISKPFGMNEVLARIRVALRHSVHVLQGTEPLITIGPLQIDFEQRLVTVNGQEVKMTPTEYDLLKVLIKYRGKIMTQQMLITQVWGTERNIQSHYLHVYIRQLRQKIEQDSTNPRLLQSVSGAGYRFSDE